MKSITAIVLLFAAAMTASAESGIFGDKRYIFTETYRTFKGGKPDEQTNVLWMQGSFKAKIFGKETGGFSWNQVSKTYRQTYWGGYVGPTSWLQVGVAGGVESVGSAARLGTFAYAAGKKNSVFAIYENSTKSGSGYWYLVISTHDVTPKFNVGWHSQAFAGHGGRFEYKFLSGERWNMSVRPAVLWLDAKDAKPDTAILGLRLTFF